ncbi:sensor histidine kinase [Altericroceibacterium xinjiangense]|uniref:sensor histidine kinase n=1 Tax=Altericroceibacterium xinjiangense TaxID=762261 RepID=UPI0019D21F52|nr:HWE histidine kinase domain-containing protein [Altericroceibacterium xinjiangense]
MHDLDSASLGAVLKTALDGVVVMRLDGTVAGWNDVAERTFGWSFTEAFGRRMSELIIPHRFREAHERGLAHYLATGEGPVMDRHIEIDALHRDGHELPVELSITRTEHFGEPVFLGFLRDITERREAARRQELLIGELNHRAKNLLGVVSGIAHQTVRSSETLADFGPSFAGRLSSLARAHEVLTASAWDRSSLQVLVESLVGDYGRGDNPSVSVAGDEVLLPPKQILSISMVLHELLTNALKFGALASSEGRIAIVWSIGERGLALDWIETGLAGVSPPTRRGFGFKMIAMSVAHELKGTSKSEWHCDGLTFRLAFPLPNQDTLQ